MSDVENLTLLVLREIRDEIKVTNNRLDQTVARLDQTVARLDDTNSRLDNTILRLDRVVQEQLRQATLLVDMRKDQEKMANALVNLDEAVRGLNSRLDNVLLGPFGQTVRDLDRRVTSVEDRLSTVERRG
ncbi:MAG: hypothetical protein HY909_20295 [Deltaproteobacteria bacterium]|nr:hypothetical protein [Deltaproteobacteria bacterium]